MSQVERSPEKQRCCKDARGAFDDNARSRSVEGAARGEEKAHHAERGGRAVRAEPALGEEADEAAAEGGRPRSHAPLAGPGVEPQDSAERAAKDREDLARRERRVWT